MAISSFTKDFTLDSKKAVDSFTKIISTPVKSVKLDRTLTSPENQKRGETKLRAILRKLEEKEKEEERIVLERLERLESDPTAGIPWRKVKRT